jgi:hypothetical protein
MNEHDYSKRQKGYNIIEQARENIDPYKMGGPYPKAYETNMLLYNARG